MSQIKQRLQSIKESLNEAKYQPTIADAKKYWDSLSARDKSSDIDEAEAEGIEFGTDRFYTDWILKYSSATVANFIKTGNNDRVEE
jgi:hypothetical protein